MGGDLMSASDSLEIRPAMPLLVQSGEPTPVAFLISNGAIARHSETLSLTCRNGTVQPESLPLSLMPGEWKLVFAKVSLNPSALEGEVVCQARDVSSRIPILHGIDLTALPWKRILTTRFAPPDPRWASPDIEDRSWPEIRAPALWNELDHAWCRVHVSLPETWRGRRIRLIMGAVDDNDITFLNGQEIGRTYGWDVPREYVLPESLIRWGQDNVLTVMAENVNAGGGLYKPPFLLLAGDTPAPAQTPSPPRGIARPRPGKIGHPLPLRRFHVDRGVLRYPEGTEVALWGVNYYPQSWHQFENMIRLRLDMKAVIRQDLDHLQQMGVEAIRIHVFDREISDGAGNLVPNIHLDLLDYLVAECSQRGIYMYLTPIAWWGGPNENKGAFSAETSKPGMMFVPEAKKAAVHYLKQFLSHINRYSGKAYKDEPCLCLLEVQNEPAYFVYGDIHGSSYAPQGERSDVLKRDHKIFRDLWQKWLAAHGLGDSPVYFPLFRYELMRLYIGEMVRAIRSTGATQPVAISYFGTNGDDLTQAIADSECDAITVSAYPGGWERVNDGINLLPQTGPLTLDARLGRKARLAYEFDTPATNTSCYLFPAIAVHFRSGEVQVACQFQYDSVSTARWNTDWNAHWLNWLYTPSKTASFMIAKETFHRLPRGLRFDTPKTELKLGPVATSFTHNLSLLITPDTVIHSRSVGEWKPLPFPRAPRLIVGVGSSPYIEYGGTGLYRLETLRKDILRLTLNPDARLVGNCLQGSFSAPVAELEEHHQWLQLKLPGWGQARCVRMEGQKAIPIPLVEGGWLLKPGVYRIYRR